MRASLAAGSLCLALVFAGVAQAQAEEELAERYAPIVRLVEQPSAGPASRPSRSTSTRSSTRRPSRSAARGAATTSSRSGRPPTTSVAVSTSTTSTSRGRSQPGCDYELWARGSPRTPSRRVAASRGGGRRPDRLALQYWLYYPFNDWNNLHEGDWEMIQLVFDAGSAEEALETEPLEVGYSQHEGAERAEWGDDKLEVVDGTHPVVYPAAGSHANFFSDSLFLGRAAEQASAATTRPARSVELRPRASRSRATRKPRRAFPGSPSRAAGASASRPTTARPGRT